MKKRKKVVYTAVELMNDKTIKKIDLEKLKIENPKEYKRIINK